MAVTVTPPINKNATARNVPISGTTIILMPTGRNLIILPAGLLALLSVDLTQCKVNNKKVRICCSQEVTAFTLVATGATFVGAITSFPVGGGFAEYIYDSATSQFVRCG